MQDLFGREHTEVTDELSEKKVPTKKSGYGKTDGPNLFAITDTLVRGARRETWTTFHRLRADGATDTEIANVLWWFLKTVLQVSRDTTNGLKPFVVSNAKKFSMKYSAPEIDILAEQLIQCEIDARTVGVPLSVRLESWILGLK